MSYSSVIFDLDGTLLDTLVDLAETCNEVLLRLGLAAHPIPAYKTFVGGGLQNLIVNIVPPGTKGSVRSRCAELFIELYARNWKRNSCPYKGIDAMLSALKRRGIKLAVLSNKPHEFTGLCVREFFPPGMFAIVYGQREGVPKKPDPAAALEIAALLGEKPQEIVFAGDSGVDIQTGKAAGMTAVGVAWGFRSIQELTDHNADKIVHNPGELEQYVVSST